VDGENERERRSRWKERGKGERRNHGKEIDS